MLVMAILYVMIVVFRENIVHLPKRNIDKISLLMKVTVIGTGNMGGALVRGLVRSGVLPAADITCTALSESTLGKLRSFDSGLVLTTDNVAAVRGADVVVICAFVAITVPRSICRSCPRNFWFSRRFTMRRQNGNSSRTFSSRFALYIAGNSLGRWSVRRFCMTGAKRR